jgi:hypothetical protein
MTIVYMEEVAGPMWLGTNLHSIPQGSWVARYHDVSKTSEFGESI